MSLSLQRLTGLHAQSVFRAAQHRTKITSSGNVRCQELSRDLF